MAVIPEVNIAVRQITSGAQFISEVRDIFTNILNWVESSGTQSSSLGCFMKSSTTTSNNRNTFIYFEVSDSGTSYTVTGKVYNPDIFQDTYNFDTVDPNSISGVQEVISINHSVTATMDVAFIDFDGQTIFINDKNVNYQPLVFGYLSNGIDSYDRFVCAKMRYSNVASLMSFTPGVSVLTGAVFNFLHLNRGSAPFKDTVKRTGDYWLFKLNGILTKSNNYGIFYLNRIYQSPSLSSYITFTHLGKKYFTLSCNDAYIPYWVVEYDNLI